MYAWYSFCLLLALPVCAITASQSSPAWILSGIGESCTETCSKTGQHCTSEGLHQHNSEANSEREMSALIGGLSGTCITHNLNYGSSTDVPAFHSSTGTCYVSDVTREEKTFSCERPASADKQRLCWCHNGLNEDAASGARKKDDDSGKLSSGVIVWIISGNMLFLGFAFMCCGIVRRFVKKSQGIAEGASLSERPADPGHFVRCPACGCPLERSSSPSTYAAYAKAAPKRNGTSSRKTKDMGLKQADEDDDIDEGVRSGQTVKFREDVSEKSFTVDAVVLAAAVDAVV